jgi:membrane-associated phospholipid phosphatase
MSATAPTRTATQAQPASRSWVRAWPLNRPAVVRATAGGALLLTVWSLIGLAYVHLLDDGATGDADRRASEWFAQRRTETWNSLTNYGSMISDTLTKVILIAVVGGIMILVWRRWHDGVFLASVVILEASVFALSSFIVDRDRPPVEQLDAIPPSGSFPSGHTAAAVAFYGGVYVVSRWHTRNRWVRGVLLAVAICAPIIVAASRVFRGMHHLSDVVAGALLGVASLIVMTAALRAGTAEIDRRSRDGAPSPEHTRSLEMIR